MSDLSHFEREFGRDVRERGQDYFYSNRVKLANLIPGQEAIFKVRGTQTYDVRLRFNPKNELVSTCTCPYFQGGYGGCKHTWAAILDADKNRFFNKAIGQIRDVTPIASGVSLPPPVKSNKSPGLPFWKHKIEKLDKQTKQRTQQKLNLATSAPISTNKRIGFFVIDPIQSSATNKWVLKFYHREQRNNRALGVIKSCTVSHEQIPEFENELDRKALWAFLGMASQAQSNHYYSNYYTPKKDFVFLEPKIMESLLIELSVAEKLFLLSSNAGLIPLKFDSNPMEMNLVLEKSLSGFTLKAIFKNETKNYLVGPDSFYLSPYLLVNLDLVRTNLDAHEEWFLLFKKDPALYIPNGDVDSFLDFYYKSPSAPELSYPDSLQIKIESQFTKVRLVIDSDLKSSLKSNGIFGQIQFLYGEDYIDHNDFRSQIFVSANRTLFRRNKDNEQIEVTKLLGIPEIIETNSSFDTNHGLLISESHLAPVVENAFNFGWEVVAFKKNVNQSKDFKAFITSGIDWFDLSVNFEFSNGMMLGLPQLLQNLKSGQRFITLADGTTGLLDKEWLKKFSNIAKAGSAEGDGIRLSKIQALFYGAELCADKNIKSDRKFKTFQRIIEDINNIQEVKLDSRFKGKLRSYQKKGLSWLSLMAKHEIGTVLADDMGLGKTIQILSLLSKETKSKSLILAPKSLVFNWMNEAKKFTPHLKFHDHTGSERTDRLKDFEKSQVIVTTYQTFRIDIEFFKEKQFDYFILDEAHYIKNSESQAYMACKLIQAKRKIALSGTPVENSLKDLFSILSVVTPGLISDSLAEKYANEMDPESIGLLSKSLRPFILRRTKDEVLKDLPQKTEQILYCELSTVERKKYTELKNFYWSNLSGKIEKKGFQRSKIEILEALLRLRQASCHLGLLNGNLAVTSSSKFDLLLEQLATVVADGHKALIFSQFTSLLGLLSKALSERKIKFEYLDGKTNNRAERVRNFQENKNIPLFLISLKAGGVGLNLTSADYVFILDPWWNPAAESQAIDRTHRIGQTKKVFAYKLIAKDTVEEKILALQEKKKALAKAIISSEKSLIKGLKMEDLRELFS